VRTRLPGSAHAPTAETASERLSPRASAERALDWLNFFLAALQAGFGPFVAIFLTENRWTQTDIGIVLSIGTIAGLLSQVPGGAFVDKVQRKELALSWAIVCLALSALMFATWPVLVVAMFALILHSLASSVQVPAVAAISIGLVARHETSERLGRNARWASLGYGGAAAAMGLFGYLLTNRAVFVLSALLALPALLALKRVRPTRRAGESSGRSAASAETARAEEDPSTASRTIAIQRGPARAGMPLRKLLMDRRMLVFAACAMLYQLANGAMLQLVGAGMTMRYGVDATLIIAAALLVPQVVVAILSPGFGRAAERYGRQPLLVAGLLALPVRAVLFALLPSAYLVVPLQILDGISSTAFAVLAPVIVADLTDGRGYFNLGMGLIGLAGGVGGAISSSLAGATADAISISVAFLPLAAAGAMATGVAWLFMPETHPLRASMSSS